MTWLKAYSRCARLVSKSDGDYSINPALLRRPGELELYRAYQQAVEMIADNPEAVIDALRSLERPIDRFFDKTKVMVKDKKTRTNRLALLQGIKGLTRGYADLSKLRGY